MNPKPDQNKMKYIQRKQENTTKTAASLNLSVKKTKNSSKNLWTVKNQDQET